MKVQIMKIRYAVTAVLAATLCLVSAPAFAVNRDIVELQTQVQALQDQMARMQQTFDERMGVMKNLLDQNTDSMNKTTTAITSLESTLQKQQNDSGSHVDQLSGQIQALNDSLDELKARLAKVSKQMEDMQTAQQNLSTQPPANGQPAPSGAPDQVGQPLQPAAQAPAPDVLYNNALRDYNAAKNDLAIQEFSDYIKYYPTTDLAGNSYFYRAELEFRQSNFQAALKDYDQVLQNFPTGNKAASAQLKKGYSFIELGQKEEGVAELRRLIQRYPRTNEALQARERLHKMGVAATGSTTRRSQ